MCSTTCATAQAQTQITEQQSIALTRNIMRVSISSIAYLRGMFDAGNFSIKDVGGTHCWVLESEDLHPNAKAIIDWMDHGVFDALKRGFLDRCVLVVSADAEGENTIEAWSLSVGENNTINLTKDAGGESTRSVAKPSALRPLTQQDLLKLSSMMLRQMVVLLQTMPQLPDQYWLSMHLTYKEGTPNEYEPEGFDPAPGGCGLRFASRPMRLGIGPAITTPHHSLGVELLSEQLDGFEEISHPLGGEEEAPSGGYNVNLSCLGPRPDPHALGLGGGSGSGSGGAAQAATAVNDAEVDEAARLYDGAVAYVRRRGVGARVSYKDLQRGVECGGGGGAGGGPTTPGVAQQIAQLLEKAGHLGALDNRSRMRAVLPPPPPSPSACGDETCASETSAGGGDSPRGSQRSGGSPRSAAGSQRAGASTPGRGGRRGGGSQGGSSQGGGSQGGGGSARRSASSASKRKASRTSGPLEFGAGAKPGAKRARR